MFVQFAKHGSEVLYKFLHLVFSYANLIVVYSFAGCEYISPRRWNQDSIKDGAEAERFISGNN